LPGGLSCCLFIEIEYETFLNSNIEIDVLLFRKLVVVVLLHQNEPLGQTPLEQLVVVEDYLLFEFDFVGGAFSPVFGLLFFFAFVLLPVLFSFIINVVRARFILVIILLELFLVMVGVILVDKQVVILRDVLLFVVVGAVIIVGELSLLVVALVSVNLRIHNV